ncbi:MAG: hypothetical protein QM817_23870 [Archangium sp.]
MLHALLLISLCGAPKAPGDAPVVGYAASIDKLASLLPFFEKAGTRSVLLRPENWKTDAHVLIDVDVTSLDALKLNGIDATGPLTRGQVGDAAMSCVRIANLDAYRKGCDAKLARLGEVFEKVESGVSVYATRDPIGRVMAAYTVQGKDSCALNGHGRSVETLLPMLAKATSKPATAPAWNLTSKVPGALQFVIPGGATTGVAAMNVKELELTVDARVKNAPFAQFAGGGASPFGAFRSSGAMAVFRGRVSKAQVPTLVEQVVRFMPGGAGLLPVAKQVAPYVTGNTAVLLSHVKVSQGLRTREARMFAVKAALLAEVSDAAAVKTLVDSLDGGLLRFAQGSLLVSLEGNVLVVANDESARAKAVAALASANGKQLHGLEFDIEPKAVAKGLQQVPLLEAVQAPELAALVAASTELGPLLVASEKINGWLDSASDATHVGKLVWQLDAAKFAADAGVSDAGVP